MLPPTARPSLRLRLGPIRRDPLAFFEELAAAGDVATVRIGPQRVYLVSDPDLVREVLVAHGRSFMKGRALQEAKRILGDGLLTSEGDLHLRQRRLIQPLFRQERVAAFEADMVRAAERVSARWQDGAEVEMAGEMTELTLAIVGRTLFDADVERDARDVGESLTVAMEAFDRFLAPGAAILERLPLPSTRAFRAAPPRLDSIIGRMIDERLADPGRHGDLLTMLLEARDEDGSGGMSRRQIRDEAMTIFLAGHETTSQALSWTWYLLSEHPQAEVRLHAELDSVLAGRSPSAADVAGLTYTRAVVAESMRLYPPAWSIARRALTDLDVGGYRITRRSIVITSPWVVHRDARWFPDPERFDPDRWLEDDPGRPRSAYFPFGAGTRICIGERFAWAEAVLVLATLASRWRAALVPGHRVEPLPRITLRPRYGLRMVLHARTSRPELVRPGIPSPA
jgi:cytochrome P450